MTPPRDLPRSLGPAAALAIMVGIMIGSGIFAAPTDIAKSAGNPWLILGLWVVGGLISLCGALTFAELGAMFPRSGGIYVYLREGLGPATAFVFGWTYMLISKPLAVAGIAIVFSDHLAALLDVRWDARITTCIVLIALTAINARGVKLGGGLAIVLTSLKILALVAIVVLAATLSAVSPENFTPTPSPTALIWSLAPIMAAILWTYDGWSDVAAIAGEVKDPQRQLPRVLLGGTLLVTALYVAVNAVYIGLVPLIEMRAMDTVAPRVAEQLIGPAGSAAITIMVLISTLGSTHGSTITGARITFAQAADGLLFSALAHVHRRFATPDVALWTQCVLSCAAVLFLGSFQKLIGGFVFTMWIFYGLAAVGVIVLRFRRPEIDRPFRCWGYPAVPLLFVTAATLMTLLSMLDSPRDTLPWLAVLALGWPAYALWTRSASKRGTLRVS